MTHKVKNFYYLALHRNSLPGLEGQHVLDKEPHTCQMGLPVITEKQARKDL